MANYYKTGLTQFPDKGSAGSASGLVDRYLPTTNGTSTDDISRLSEEKRTIEERIAFLKEEIARQRNIKDAEGSPLMEIALYRFNTYGDPSGLSEIANRQQTKDMADLQKSEADEANIKATKDKLGRLNIIAKNARDILNDAKTKNENSDEHKSAVRDYNLARYDLISAAKDTNDDELLQQYMDAYPEEIDIASSNSSEGKSLVNIEDEYKNISLNNDMSPSDRAKELNKRGKPKDMSDAGWITLKNELNTNLKSAYEKAVKEYKAYEWRKENKALFDERETANRDRIREINKALRKNGVSEDDIKKVKYPSFKDVKKPEEPEYLK